MWTILRAIRVQQWLKNMLVFVPIITSHQIIHPQYVLTGIVAFIAFSLCSSGTYVLNDVLDVHSDRIHSEKRHRPFASGELPLRLGFFMSPGLMLAGIAVGWLLSIRFILVLMSYLAITTCYSLYLKQVVLVDVMLLAFLYILRMVAGSVATGIPYSAWLMAFSMFLFLSLAFAKRFAELFDLQQQGGHATAGRGYFAGDKYQIAILGTSSGYISVLVLALYINSEAVVSLYESSALLWLLCPLMLYWISRIWLLAHRGELNQDPILFAIRDKVSYGLVCSMGIIMFLATTRVMM